MRVLDTKFHIEDDRIVKTASNEIVPESEPLFLLRARDRLAIALLNYYRCLCLLDGCNDFQLEGLQKVITDFERFRDDNPDQMKQPGITRGLPYDKVSGEK